MSLAIYGKTVMVICLYVSFLFPYKGSFKLWGILIENIKEIWFGINFGVNGDSSSENSLTSFPVLQ